MFGRFWAIVGSTVLLLVLVQPAAAELVSVDITQERIDLPVDPQQFNLVLPFELVFSDLPDKPLGDAIVTLTAQSDFDHNGFEWMGIDVVRLPDVAPTYTFPMGTVFNGVTGDDEFDLDPDVGTQWGPPVTTTGIIPHSELAQLLTGTGIQFAFTFGPSVNRSAENDDFVRIRLQYVAVPEPSSLAMLAGLAGIGLACCLRRRKGAV